MDTLTGAAPFLAAVAGLLTALVSIPRRDRRLLSRLERLASLAEKLPPGDTRTALLARVESEASGLVAPRQFGLVAALDRGTDPSFLTIFVVACIAVPGVVVLWVIPNAGTGNAFGIAVSITSVVAGLWFGISLGRGLLRGDFAGVSFRRRKD